MRVSQKTPPTPPPSYLPPSELLVMWLSCIGLKLVPFWLLVILDLGHSFQKNSSERRVKALLSWSILQFWLRLAVSNILSQNLLCVVFVYFTLSHLTSIFVIQKAGVVLSKTSKSQVRVMIQGLLLPIHPSLCFFDSLSTTWLSCGPQKERLSSAFLVRYPSLQICRDMTCFYDVLCPPISLLQTKWLQ